MSDERLLTVIIPVYNEEGTITEVISEVKKISKQIPLEIIVVNDASTDQTVGEIKKFSDIVLVEHQNNMGKTECIKSGLAKAKGVFVIIQDGDLEYPPSNISEIYKLAITSNANAIYGKRNFEKVILLQTKLGLWVTNFLMKLFFKVDIHDVNTGHKLFYKEDLVAMNLKYKRFSFCVESTYYLLKNNKKIIEVPIEYFPRSKEQGKKISFVDGIEIVLTLIFLRLRDFIK